MTPEAKLLTSYVWDSEPMLDAAERYCNSNKAADKRIRIGKWEMLFRVTQNAATYDDFYRQLQTHLQPIPPPEEPVKPKAPAPSEATRTPGKKELDALDFTKRLMTAIGEAASFPDEEHQQEFLLTRQKRLSDPEKKMVEDSWRLARARTFLHEVVRRLKTEDTEQARSAA